MNIESQLRQTLHRAADDLGPAEPPDAVRLTGMQSLAHRRKRRGVAVLSAGLSVLLLAVAVPAGLTLVSGPDNGDTRQNGVAAPPPAPSAAPDIYGGPTRGSLAGDAAFVESVRQLSWTSFSPDPEGTLQPPVEARRVVFAGDVAAGRWPWSSAISPPRPRPRRRYRLPRRRYRIPSRPSRPLALPSSAARRAARPSKRLPSKPPSS